MIVSRSLIIVLFLAAHAAPPSWALDPMRTDILGFRLGMTETEVLNKLTIQGAGVTRAGPCGQSPCVVPVLARLTDGTMTIQFGPDGRVRRVDYRFAGPVAKDNPIVREAVLDHYGAPAAADPLSWCRRPTEHGSCPDGAPMLTFTQAGGVRGLLSLAAEGRDRSPSDPAEFSQRP